MARFYRRRRRFGGYRRKFFRRRFGIGGGNRKRPSSYSVAYGFTKQFDKLLTKASNTGLDPETIYECPTYLAHLARLFFSLDLQNTQYSAPSITNQILNNEMFNSLAEFELSFFTGVLVNHIDNDSRLINIIQKSVTEMKSWDDIAPRYPHAQVPARVDADGQPIAQRPAISVRVFKEAKVGPNNEVSFLFTAFKTQFKDALQKCTKRNLPIALAVASWAYSFLKHKKKKKGRLSFWKWKSVPRFMVLLTISTMELWKETKFGVALINIIREIEFVRNKISQNKLYKMAAAGVPDAQAILARQFSNNPHNPQGEAVAFGVGTRLGRDLAET